MMFCFRSILQIWIILIGFRDMKDFVNLSICKHDFKFTCRGAAEAIADLPKKQWWQSTKVSQVIIFKF